MAGCCTQASCVGAPGHGGAPDEFGEMGSATTVVIEELEFPLEELPRALDVREEVVNVVRSAGYRYVTLDLEGLRSGNLNAALAPANARRPVTHEEEVPA